MEPSSKPNKDHQSVLVIACGGTGGHFFPGMAIAKEFQVNGGYPILFVGGHNSGKQIAVAEREGVKAIAVPAFKLPNSLFQIPKFILCFSYSILNNFLKLRGHKVEIVVGMGSYASIPVGIAAVLNRSPLIIHEGNAVLGRSNRFLARWAKAILLSFPITLNFGAKAKIEIVGMPIRKTIMDSANLTKLTISKHNKLCKEYNLNPQLPVLLVFGGSQGSQRINNLMAETIGLMDDDVSLFQVIHLTGRMNNDRLTELCKRNGLQHVIKNNEESIENLLMLSDFIVCRAGASTIFEIVTLNKRALYIPLPTAADNHQLKNASFAVENGRGEVLEEKNATPKKMVEILKKWLMNPHEDLAVLDQQNKLAQGNSAEKIVQVVNRYLDP